MKMKKLLLAMLCSTVLLSGCALKKDVIMTINDEQITKRQYEKLLDEYIERSPFAQAGADIKKDKSNIFYIMMKERTINDLIVKTLLEQEISKKHITVSKDEVNAEIKSMAEKVGSQEKLEEVLKKNNISIKQFKKDVEENKKIKKLVNIVDVTSVSDAQAKKYYNTNIEKFKYPDRVRAEHILISANPEELKSIIPASKTNEKMTPAQIDEEVKKLMAEKKKIAENILAQVKANPKDFENIAKAKSDDKVSAVKGGDLGYFDKSAMVPEFSKVAFSIKPETVSALVQTQYGYHIIIVKDRIKAGVEPFNKVKEDIKVYLDEQQKMELMQKYIEGLRRNADIKYADPAYNPDNIAKELKEQAKKTPALTDMQKPAGE